MAKVSFSKFQISVNPEVEIKTCNNKSGEPITYEVKKYLPIKEKAEVISSIINQCADDKDYFNPIKLDIYIAIELTQAYTNITFTEKMKEDPYKIYDMLTVSGIWNEIIDYIEGDYFYIKYTINDVIDNIYKYKNSVMGILDTISQDYSNLNLDATNIQKALNDPENMTLLRNVLDKLG